MTWWNPLSWLADSNQATATPTRSGGARHMKVLDRTAIHFT